ncbi:hypothetical protein AURDEDRAFT_111096 [Auricularia subglabra TFB-10046 SS5]|nr:hypothetical protein AURDEDRAFT_111096 [Auricularia subglabra TFB-10046 SS5]
MFQHAIGGDMGEYGRGPYLTEESRIEDLFHQDLRRFEALFVRMSRYLTIPWYLYCVADAKRTATGATGTASKLVASRAGTQGSATLASRTGTRGSTSLAPRTESHGSTSSLKRKAETEAFRPAKRKASELATTGDDVDTEDEGDDGFDGLPTEGDAPTDDCTQDAGATGKFADVPQAEYLASEHEDSTSAAAARLMFWKDRSLWFGSGIDPNPKPKTESAM